MVLVHMTKIMDQKVYLVIHHMRDWQRSYKRHDQGGHFPIIGFQNWRSGFQEISIIGLQRSFIEHLHPFLIIRQKELRYLL